MTRRGPPIGVSPEVSEILRAVRRIVRRVESHSREMEERLGVSTAQLLLLEAVAQAEAASQVELGERIDLAPSTMVGVTDRLVAAGLVARERVPEDRRRYHVRLTEGGRAFLAKAPSTLHHRFLARLGALPEADRHRLAGALAEIVGLLEAESVPAAAILTAGEIPCPGPSGAPSGGPAQEPPEGA